MIGKRQSRISNVRTRRSIKNTMAIPTMAKSKTEMTGTAAMEKVRHTKRDTAFAVSTIFTFFSTISAGVAQNEAAQGAPKVAAMVAGIPFCFATKRSISCSTLVFLKYMLTVYTILNDFSIVNMQNNFKRFCSFVSSFYNLLAFPPGTEKNFTWFVYRNPVFYSSVECYPSCVLDFPLIFRYNFCIRFFSTDFPERKRMVVVLAFLFPLS